MKKVKEQIGKVTEGREGVALPEEFLQYLELIPGADVCVELDEKKKRIIVRPISDEDFVKHFKESMENMA
jgi:bifunctional DNA-binding transcriptional regulator/antitoxin component of YhaV-PrlF toxin-antitoxin module